MFHFNHVIAQGAFGLGFLDTNNPQALSPLWEATISLAVQYLAHMRGMICNGMMGSSCLPVDRINAIGFEPR